MPWCTGAGMLCPLWHLSPDGQRVCLGRYPWSRLCTTWRILVQSWQPNPSCGPVLPGHAGTTQSETSLLVGWSACSNPEL